MESMLLTPYDGAILGPIAKVLGWIMEVIYNFMYNVFGIENVGLSIVLLTIVIYTLLMPFTIKQQKFSKLMQKMQPEIKEIQEKYKNRKDQASQMAMSQEMQFIYDKYGVSPMGSCWQMLIQMPIWFALFRVFSNVPAYINTVENKFGNIVNEIKNQENFATIMENIKADNNIITDVATNFTSTDPGVAESSIVDVIYKLPSLDKLVTGTDPEHYFQNLETVNNLISDPEKVDKFFEFNNFLGMNVSDNPFSIIQENFSAQNYLLVFAALALPLIYYFVQKYSLKLSSTSNGKKNDPNDMMGQQMNMMNKTMPLLMVVMCFFTPVGLGIYWVTSSAYRVVQQLVLNKYFEKIDLEQIIEKNKEKAAKKREKMGVYENQIREAAAMKTRTLTSKASYDNSAVEDIETQIERANEMKTTAKPGSLSAKANMVREYNERNSRK